MSKFFYELLAMFGPPFACRQAFLLSDHAKDLAPITPPVFDLI